MQCSQSCPFLRPSFRVLPGADEEIEACPRSGKLGSLAATHPWTIWTPLAVLYSFSRRLVAALRGFLKILFLGWVFLRFTLSRALLLSTRSIVAVLLNHALRVCKVGS